MIDITPINNDIFVKIDDILYIYKIDTTHLYKNETSPGFTFKQIKNTKSTEYRKIVKLIKLNTL